MSERRLTDEQQGAFEPLLFPQPGRDESALVNVSWCAFTQTINLNCISGYMLINGVLGNANVLLDVDSARLVADYIMEAADRVAGESPSDKELAKATRRIAELELVLAWFTGGNTPPNMLPDCTRDELETLERYGVREATMELSLRDNVGDRDDSARDAWEESR